MTAKGETRDRRDRAWDDEFTLLCERCGYVLEGLPTEGACPECGKAIAESLPERRGGTAWQQRPVVRTLPRAWWSLVRHPLRTLDAMRPESRLDRRLGRYSMLAGGLLMGWGWWVPHVWIYDDFPGLGTLGSLQRMGYISISLGFVGVTGLLIACVLWVLTRIESNGLGVIARARGFRLSREYRRAITAHGCAGWVLGGLLFMLTQFAANQTLGAFTPPDYAFGEFDDGTPMLFSQGPNLPVWLERAIWHTRWLGVLLGFLWFETFAWLGLRRLKFANTQRPKHYTMEYAGSKSSDQ